MIDYLWKKKWSNDSQKSEQSNFIKDKYFITKELHQSKKLQKSNKQL